MIKRLSFLLRVLISFFLLTVFVFFLAWQLCLHTSVVSDEHGVKYTVAKGASIKSVTQELYQANIIKHPWFFEMLILLHDKQHSLKAGEYLFARGTTAAHLLLQITTGTGLAYHSFTVISGWNFKQLRQELLTHGDLQHLSLTLSDQAIMAKMGNAALSPEGEFFPDTYYFVAGTSDLTILKMAFNLMQKKLQDAWLRRDAGLMFKTPVEALNVASLVEKEAKVAKDRSLIAGVILNRLHANMPLQIDPTVIYAIGDKYDGTIHRQDLKTKSPYNTYLNKGLPPTPIAMPSMDSIEAVLHPDHHAYLYFVAKNDGYGEHQFSETLAEHNLAVAAAERNKAQRGFFNEELIKKYMKKGLSS